MVITIDRQEYVIENMSDIEIAIDSYVEHKKLLEYKKNLLDIQKEKIINFAKSYIENSDSSTVTLDNGRFKITLGFGVDIKIGDLEKLRQILGDSFDLLVKTKMDYSPEPRLKNMAMDDESIRNCFVFKEKVPSVIIKA